MDKELRLDCPACRTRLVVDQRTGRVVSHQAPSEGETGGRPTVRDSDWSAAMRRVSTRREAGGDRFEAALSKEGRRERDLDDLFAAQRKKHLSVHDAPSTSERDDLGHGSVTERERWGSRAWIERLQGVFVSALEDRVDALAAAPGDPWHASKARFGKLITLRSDGGSALFGLSAETADDLAPALRFLEGTVGTCFADVCPELEHGEGLVARELSGQGWLVHGLDPVWARTLEELPDEDPGAPRVRAIEAGEERVWARTLLEGFETPAAELEARVERLAVEFAGPRWSCFLGFLEERPVAAAAAFCEDGVVQMERAATLPAARGRGFQGALLRARLRLGGERGCLFASGCSERFGHSQRAFRSANFELGFSKLLFRPPHSG